MNESQAILNFAPILQWGFAGFALALLAVLVWLVRQLLAVLKASNEIIAGNTVAMHDVSSTSREVKRTQEKIHDQLLQWSCPYQTQT